MAGASTWADDVRRDETSPFYGTGHWHFIDIPRGAVPGDPGRFCPPRTGCVLAAINDQLAVLRTGTTDRRRAAVALMLVIHLVADLHQPLHCATNNDLGANCVPVAYFGIQPQLSPDHPENNVYQPNLHAVWDTDIIRRITGRRGAVWLADLLERRFRSQMASWQRTPVDLKRWAWESHQTAERTAYGQLPTAVPVEPPDRVTDCSQVSRKMLALHQRLGQRYQDMVTPAIEEQLAKAGVRLAMVLNGLWP